RARQDQRQSRDPEVECPSGPHREGVVLDSRLVFWVAVRDHQEGCHGGIP
ncbi:hypothetical protein Tco_0623669, partial [Tanacetum coccineum]